jgi:hypothetical protein
MEKKFEIGDVVRIVNSGALYTTYKDAAKKMFLKNYAYASTRVYKDLDYIIVGIIKHHFTKEYVYGISDGEKEFIIGGYGLKLVEKALEEKIELSPSKFNIDSLYEFDAG